MKNLFKLFTILSFVLITNLALAQEEVPKTYLYCQLTGSSTSLNSRLTVSIDLGLEKPKLNDRTIIDSSTRKPKIFNSFVDALNYMSEQGWEFVQAYVVVDGTDSTTFWILKKRKE